MLGRLLQVIFVPRRARAKLALRDRAAPAAAARAAPPDSRERLLKDAMAVYRRQREAYDSLDEETRRQIEADAEKAFGRVLKSNR